MRITLLRWEPWNDADWKRVVARDFHAFCVKIYRGAQRPRLGAGGFSRKILSGISDAWSCSQIALTL
jgi:hypothetical protein